MRDFIAAENASLALGHSATTSLQARHWKTEARVSISASSKPLIRFSARAHLRSSRTFAVHGRFGHTFHFPGSFLERIWY